MPAGRPTKYTPELVAKAWAYIDDYAPHAIPSAQGMSMVLKVDESTLYAWAKDEDKEFSNILAKCKSAQHFALIDGGLKSDLNSNIVKLALGKHGYSDKSSQEHTGKDGSPLTLLLAEISGKTLEPGD